MSCPSCFSGGLHEHAAPAGRESTLYGLPVYIVEPENSRGHLVYITDVFGWTSSNNRALADRYAAKMNVTVYVPDFMNGNAPDQKTTGPAADVVTGITPAGTFTKITSLLSIMPTMVSWKYATRDAVTGPIVHSFLASLRAAHPAPAFLGLAGFCWGGSFVFRYCASSLAGDGVSVDAGFVAHPRAASFLTNPAEMEAVDKPLALALGSEDSVIKADAVAYLREKLADKGERAEVVVYEGAKHGFATRSRDEMGERAARQAEEQACAWFDKWIVKGKATDG